MPCKSKNALAFSENSNS